MPDSFLIFIAIGIALVMHAQRCRYRHHRPRPIRGAIMNALLWVNCYSSYY